MLVRVGARFVAHPVATVSPPLEQPALHPPLAARRRSLPPRCRSGRSGILVGPSAKGRCPVRHSQPATDAASCRPRSCDAAQTGMCSGNADATENVACTAVGAALIAAAVNTTGATEAVCCEHSQGLCSGNTDPAEDVVCTMLGGALIDAAGTTAGATEDVCCLVTGVCVGNTDTTMDVECFHFGTSLYDPVVMGQNESACCDAGRK